MSAPHIKIPNTTDDRKKIREYLGEHINMLMNEKLYHNKAIQNLLDEKIEDIRRLMLFLGYSKEEVESLVITDPPNDGNYYIRVYGKWVRFDDNGIPPGGDFLSILTRDGDNKLIWIKPIANREQLGFVKPDGVTTNVDSNGVISSNNNHDFIENRDAENSHPANAISIDVDDNLLNDQIYIGEDMITTVQKMIETLLATKLSISAFEQYTLLHQSAFDIYKDEVKNQLDIRSVAIEQIKKTLEDQYVKKNDIIQHPDNTYTKQDIDVIISRIDSELSKLENSGGSSGQQEITSKDLLHKIILSIVQDDFDSKGKPSDYSDSLFIAQNGTIIVNPVVSPGTVDSTGLFSLDNNKKLTINYTDIPTYNIISQTLANKIHVHEISDVNGLQSILSSFASASDVASLQRDIVNITTGSSSSSEILENAKNDIIALQSNSNQIQQNVASLQQQISNVTSSISNFESTVNDIKSKTEANESSINSLNQNITTLESTVESLDVNVTSLTTKSETNATNITALQTENTKLKAEIDDLKKQLEALSFHNLIVTNNENSISNIKENDVVLLTTE